MVRGKFKGKPTGRRHFSTPEELIAGTTATRPRTFSQEEAAENVEEESEEELGEPSEKQKGTLGLIEINNPNLVKPKNLKAKDADIGKITELSRRERVEIEKQKAHERHMKLQEQGKTEQSRKDLERLALIRKRRAEAARKREEDKADIHWDNARYFLMYPRFDCEHDYMYNNICDKLPQKVTFMRVVKERHKRVTSTPFHIQAAFRICSRNPKLLDIDGNHPNIQAVTRHELGYKPLSLILCGISRTGKTLWARSLVLHNYYTGHINLKSHDNQAQYNIIDDIPYEFCKHKKELLGAQRD
ncbi:hypothetical protein D5086_003271 [Populus alba]|uniref:Uncharacterized protein n=1 Tax=Populus alba TaxID=43335 RepID=A0ACC4D414_POPAL